MVTLDALAFVNVLLIYVLVICKLLNNYARGLRRAKI